MADPEDEDSQDTANDGQDEEEEEVLLHDSLRGHFPMAFGEQERKAPMPMDVHAATQRKPQPPIGPPRPPPGLPQQAQPTADIVGPPSRPAEAQAAAASRDAPGGAPDPSEPAEEDAGAPGEQVGPPRPKARDFSHLMFEEGPVSSAGGHGPAKPSMDDIRAGPQPTSSGVETATAASTTPREVEGLMDNGMGEEDEEDADDPYNLPISHEVLLEGHGKVVMAVDVDHSGSRCVSGSADYAVRIFDFNGMKSDMKSFRRLEPSEGHPVCALSWSPTGDAFLVATGSPQIRVYDRDGVLRGESVRGDMYIRDQRNTKGHVSGCTGGCWHPNDRYTAITSSEDGTVRVWDVWNVLQKTVVKPGLARPGRVHVTACGYNSDGGMIGAGLNDGSIQLWDVKGKFGRSAAIGQVMPPKAQMVGKQDWSYVQGARNVARAAHEAQCEITSLAFSQDNATLISRATDDTLKVWDVRKLKEPVKVFAGLPTLHSATAACFSPDERLILTGTDASKDGPGSLIFFDRQRLEMVRALRMPGNVVGLAWHPRLNQILVGAGDRKQGAVRVLYDPNFSERGVLLCAGRKLRPKDPFEFQAPLIIHTPHALPMFREEKGGRKRVREKARQDPVKSRMPDPGAGTGLGPGGGGRIGTTGGTLLTQYILKNQGMMHNPEEEDVRAAILRHADKEDEMSAYTAAYKKTQPVRIYAKDDEEEGGDK